MIFFILYIGIREPDLIPSPFYIPFPIPFGGGEYVDYVCISIFTLLSIAGGLPRRLAIFSLRRAERVDAIAQRTLTLLFFGGHDKGSQPILPTTIIPQDTYILP